MGKHKKTRQEKIIADLRRKLVSAKQTSSAPTDSPSSLRYSLDHAYTPTIHVRIPTTVLYPYLRKDLLRTLAVTGSIILTELLLFFFVKNHILAVPNVRF